MHEDEAALETAPSVQSSQTGGFLAWFKNLPAVQSEHWLEPGPEDSPVPHRVHALPSSDAVPASHGAQVLPSYDVPGEHGVHATDPGSLNPDGQLSHVSDAPRENVFAPHCSSPIRNPFESLTVE